MVLENVTIGTMGQLVSRHFSFSEFLTSLKPMILFLVGIALYSFFVFKFYRYLAKRDIFEIHKKKGHVGVLRVISYTLEYLLLTPILVFFWFAVLTVLFILISKMQSATTLLLLSVAIVAVVRITSYYNENLSQDLAKMIPFALLGVFLVDMSYFSLESSMEVVKQLPGLWKEMVYYLLFVVLVEFVMRIGYSSFRMIVPEKEEED